MNSVKAAIITATIALASTHAYAQQPAQVNASEFDWEKYSGKEVEIPDCQANDMEDSSRPYSKSGFVCVFKESSIFEIPVNTDNVPKEQLAFGEKYCGYGFHKPECFAAIKGVPDWKFGSGGVLRATSVKWHSEDLPRQKIELHDFIKNFRQYYGKPVEITDCHLAVGFTKTPFCKVKGKFDITTNILPEEELAAAIKCAEAYKCIVSISGWPEASLTSRVRAISITIIKQEAKKGWW